MAVRWSRVAPQIALMPALLLVAVGFVGTIGWTILISFTKSRRFPEFIFDPNGWTSQYEPALQ